MTTKDADARPRAQDAGPDSRSSTLPPALGDLPGASTHPLAALAALVPELKLMAGLLTGAAIIAALYFGRDILIPLALAFLLGFLLDPVVVRLKRWGLPRAPAVILVVTLVLGMLGLGGLFLGNQVSALSAQLPTYQTNIRHKLRDLRAAFDKPGMFDGAMRTLDTVKKEVEKEAPAPQAAPAPPQRVVIAERTPSPMEQLINGVNKASGPLATAGIVLVFVVLILLDRLDLRDRLVRLWGGSVHRSTDAMDEAARRISRYLGMQLVVNLTYGLPMAAGLWLIGVPGFMLWGAIAAVMRFVPYVGPMISAAFPIALAFAVDPGWSMVLWTIGLIVVLELVSNNIVEPWLYGASTGLSALSLIVAAIFWTALWGPIGLIMSTPLTVCLLVIGRYLPRLHFLDVLLGSHPALDTPTRIYQRLIAGDVEEAGDLAEEQVDKGSVTAFYNETALQVLRMSSIDHGRVATAEHRHRVVTGMYALIDDLEEEHPAPVRDAAPHVVCIGGKWEVDNIAARMLGHALSLEGQGAGWRAASTLTAEHIDGLDLHDAQCVCLSYFSPQPEIQARHFCRRLRRRWPKVKIVLGLWNASPELRGEDAAESLGADAIVGGIDEAVVRISDLMGTRLSESFMEAIVPEADALRLQALRASGALDARAQPLFDAAAQRAADIFDMPMAMVSLIDESRQQIGGSWGKLAWPRGSGKPTVRGEDMEIDRTVSLCGHVVANAQSVIVPDVSKDMRFAGNAALREKGIRFYAGAPLRAEGGHVIGTLCLLDNEPRVLNPREGRLLQAMADDLMKALANSVAQWGDMLPVQPEPEEGSSATLGQAVPQGT
ncbi:AI-2E family transporter [Variovorax dokdonensis]|uniref:AI-2E family transporter n=1 Tax=Variovorax dokdonensis TaxID=344883 RepID=A0ABT7N898_9BURK|nr:AI-2E family transporter [Variovorax dokdonensis]MDM0044168.1 AI-2E family transporter [Variovorax dokdonensis]